MVCMSPIPIAMDFACNQLVLATITLGVFQLSADVLVLDLLYIKHSMIFLFNRAASQPAWQACEKVMAVG